MSGRYFREWSVAAALLLLLATLTVAAPAFFRPAPLAALMLEAVPVLLAASGMAMVIVCRQIDISIGSQFAVCSILAGLAASAGWPMPIAALAALGAGALLGAVNGAFVAGLGLPPSSSRLLRW